MVGGVMGSSAWRRRSVDANTEVSSSVCSCERTCNTRRAWIGAWASDASVSVYRGFPAVKGQRGECDGVRHDCTDSSSS